jgi:hypothetical protein
MVETSALYGDGMEELKDAVFLSILGGRLDT